MYKKIINALNGLHMDYKEFSEVKFLKKGYTIYNVICVNDKFIEVSDLIVLWDMNGDWIHGIKEENVYMVMFELGMYINS